MQDTTFPDIETLTKLLENAMLRVMQTTAHMTAKFLRRLPTAEADGTPFYAAGSIDPLIVGSVGFTGEANGMVYLYMEMELASQIAAGITGMTAAEILHPDNNDIVKDVVGEITNMTVGTFKNGICDLGFQCKVTLPTVLRGSQLQVGTVTGAQRWTFAFEVLGRPLIADLFIQEDKGN
ncbi:MAG: chemotaxis protein CheX [Opitutaceae bacterium]|nr:chemotaxis protein CheX [Opitutaceae bacterium]